MADKVLKRGGVFRIANDAELTAELLAEYIDYYKKNDAPHYEELKRAYETEYDIFTKTPKEDYKPDNRIAVNYAKYITDTFDGFFMGIPVKYHSDDETVAAFLELVNAYNSVTDETAELCKLSTIFGTAYEMYYTNETGDICFTQLSPLDAFIVFDESILNRPRYFVRMYTDTAGTLRGSVSNETTVYYFAYDDGVHFEDYEHAHGFDGVPVTEYRLNEERQGLFEPVLSAINAYNKGISEKANDVDYFSDAYLAILGAKLDETDLPYIRSNRIINFSGQYDGKLDVKFLSKPDADASQEHLLDRLRDDIFTVAMVTNISNESFGSASGQALKQRMQPMVNLAARIKSKFEGGFNRRYKLIFSNPASGMNGDAWATIRYTFTPNYPNNVLEEAQAAAALAGVTSRKTQLKAVSLVDDVQAEMEQIEREAESITDYLTDYPTDRNGAGEESGG